MRGFKLSLASVLSAAFLSTAGTAMAGTVQSQISSEDGAALSDAVIFAVPNSGPASTTSAKTLMIQENQEFDPFVLPVQMGTTVEFPNRDSFRHHVYSFSPAKPFELKLFGGTETQIVTFDKEGAVALGCNIHDNMLAYIYVVPTPYFAKTDATGKAALSNLPAGSYSVKVWHPNQKGDSPAQTLTVAADGTADFKTTVALKRDRKAKKAGAKDEVDY